MNLKYIFKKDFYVCVYTLCKLISVLDVGSICIFGKFYSFSC